MLARALRPQARQAAVRAQSQQSAAETLTLPWLCPALQRFYTVNANRHETRTMATAAQASYASAPFQGIAQAYSTRMPDPQLSKLPTWDPARPLVVHDATATAVTPSMMPRYGVGGDPTELRQNLDACLRVGRFERASSILKRLEDMYAPDAPGLLDSYEIYLQALFEQAQQNPSDTSLADIEAWYQKTMVAKGIKPTAMTFVPLIRAVMNFAPPDEQEARVQHYLAEAQSHGPHVREAITKSTDFSDEEWHMLVRLQPEDYKEPPPVEQVQAAQRSDPEMIELAADHDFVSNRPEPLKAVPQKGLGLSSLKESLQVFESADKVAFPHDMEGTPEEKEEAYNRRRQMQIEEDAEEAAVKRWESENQKLKDMGIHGVLISKPIQGLMSEWHKTFVALFDAEIKRTKEILTNPDKTNQRDDRHRFGPWLEGLNPTIVGAMALSRIMSSAAGTSKRDADDAQNGLRMTGMAVQIGRDVEMHFNQGGKRRHDNLMKKLRLKQREELLEKLSKSKKEGPAQPLKSEESATATAEPAETQENYVRKAFPLAVRVQLGMLVIDTIIKSATVTDEKKDPQTGEMVSISQPVFQHHIGYNNGKRISYIVVHHKILEKLRNESVQYIHNIKLPMLVEPKPWVAFEEGGYYKIKEQVVRTKMGDSQQKLYAKRAIARGDMKQVLAALDVLGKVPWKINQDVYHVMAEAWNKGEGIASMVPEDNNLQRPEEPGPDASHKERMQFMAAMKEYMNAKSGLHSQRSFQNQQLEVARAFLNEKKFYYPHSVDFRGRAYPIPPVLNHIGADMPRGLLLFANGKELGEVGLQWLKIQLANLYGFDKASLKDREQFAMDNLEHIYDSANNPLTGKRWWVKADDPWQCLACCIEIKNALESPDPTRYVSHLPVHQDGTCNGLQHYAALGGDEAGASQVNLEPSDKPQDIYTGVAELVKEMIAADVEKNNELAKVLDGKITRTVVKRTVMTNVYGVTFVGARNQVLDELKHVFSPEELKSVPALEVLAQYTAKKIFLALGRIFNGAQEIQVWLGECGDRITTSLSAEQVQKVKDAYDGKEPGFSAEYKVPVYRGKKAKLNKRLVTQAKKETEAFKTGIIWTTPLQMPVVQPYRKDALKVVKTRMGAVQVATSAQHDSVNRRKQLQAFPPNFIHSLDATHMILSALKCSELGMDFAAVHDSFWTHAASIPDLNVVLRDAFVRMHSEDIIGRLRAEFEARYRGSMYLAKLAGHSSVAAEIVAFRGDKGKSHTNTHMSELAAEATRQELLKSEDPELRKKGEEMVTPTSIWLKYKDTSSLASERMNLIGDEGHRAEAKIKEVAKKVEHEALVENSDGEVVAPTDKSLDDFLQEDTEDTEVKDKFAGMDDEERANAIRAKKRSIVASAVKVWLPLTFPPVPKRGSWDVRRLHESKYFFS